VSRGVGSLQESILDELRRAPGAHLPWSKLRERFPREVADKSFFRAARGLLTRGLVYEQHIVGCRYIGLTCEADRELTALVDEAHRRLAAIARARGVPVPSLTERLRETRRGHLKANRDLSE